MINRLLLENTLKNLLVFILLVALYGPVKDEILSFSTDSIGYQTIITLSALLIMAFLFAMYSFTFRDSHLEMPLQRLFDYLNTGVVIFGCGLLLEIGYITINALLQSAFTFMGVLMILFYVALVLYDFWDMMRYKG